MAEHLTVCLFTMEGCVHCEALKEGRPSKIEQVETVCSRGCQTYKHFHLTNGVLSPAPATKQEKAIATKVTGYPTLVTQLGNEIEFHGGGDKIAKFIQALTPQRTRKRRGTPFEDGSSSSTSSSSSSRKRRRASFTA